MEIIEVTSKEYINIIPTPYYIYGSGQFSQLNESKVEKVYYLLFRDNKYRLGLTAGIKEYRLLSPFSAPFGGFVFLKEDLRISYLEDAIEVLIQWCKRKNINYIQITLPPPIYNENFVAKQENAFFRKGFKIEKVDLNFSFNLTNFDNNYSEIIWYSARKNLKISFSNNLELVECLSEDDKIKAYDIIRQNREKRGFPLRMTWEQVKATSTLIPADFFLVNTADHISIASAIVFKVSKNVVQVIYWGSLPEYNNLKPMNFISYKLFDHYSKLRYKIIDIGPSTENSIPNYGLCEFKESIGCNIYQKLTFSKKLN